MKLLKLQKKNSHTILSKFAILCCVVTFPDDLPHPEGGGWTVSLLPFS